MAAIKTEESQLQDNQDAEENDDVEISGDVCPSKKRTKRRNRRKKGTSAGAFVNQTLVQILHSVCFAGAAENDAESEQADNAENGGQNLENELNGCSLDDVAENGDGPSEKSGKKKKKRSNKKKTDSSDTATEQVKQTVPPSIAISALYSKGKLSEGELDTFP